MFKLGQIADRINAKLSGDRDIVVSFISSLDNIRPNSILFISDTKHLDKKKIPDNVIVLIDKDHHKNIDNISNVLISDDVGKSWILLLNLFKKKPSVPNKVNLSLYKNLSILGSVLVGKKVHIGINCTFGNNVIIEDNVVIGDNVFIENNVVVGHDCKIGNSVSIDSGSIIGSEGFGNILTENSSWSHIPHIGSVVIKNNVSIGANCCIDRGTLDDTVIHQGVIIDNLVHIAHNVIIGENTAIAAKVGIAGSCNIGKRNMIGGMVGIVDHIKTADDVIISATSTVYKNIKEPGTYTGIMPIAKHSRWKRIALWITKLDKIANF